MPWPPPTSQATSTPPRRPAERLAFEELFLYQAALVTRRGRRLASGPGLELPPAGGELVLTWLDSLPFELTGDQRAAIDQIDSDLAGPEPMQRLLMGEVGSGKTVCALYAMLRAVEGGRQAALMAPTETLAEQHFRTLESLLGPETAPPPCSPRRRRRRGAASCWSRSRAGSPRSWSAPTR